MPKSHRKKTRRGGGWFDDLKNKATGLTSGMSTSSWSPSSWSSGMSTSSWNPFAKKETPSASTSYTPSASTSYTPSASTPSELSPPTTYTSPTTQTMGGRRRAKRGGSYSANMSQTNLAATASPISGIQTVKAQTWVGGKTKRRRRRHKHNKSCKHRK
jgi:hypothetical protein